MPKIRDFIIILLFTTIISINYAADDYISNSNIDSFSGSWTTKTSSCVLNISNTGSFFTINVYDTCDNPSKVNVSNVSWDGECLKFTTKCENTKWTVHHKISLINRCSISDDMTGDTKLDNNIWRKKQCQMPSGS